MPTDPAMTDDDPDRFIVVDAEQPLEDVVAQVIDALEAR